MHTVKQAALALSCQRVDTFRFGQRLFDETGCADWKSDYAWWRNGNGLPKYMYMYLDYSYRRRERIEGEAR